MANNRLPRKSYISAKLQAAKVQWASPMQRAAFEYGPDPMCMSGGYGSGKTFLGALKALFVSDVFPRNRGVIARRKWVDLQKTTMSTFFKLCPPEAYMYGRRSDQEKILKLNNGSEIIWLHLDDPEQENVIQGIEINWFLIDQAEEVEEEIFDKLSARLGRWDQAEVPAWLLDWWAETYAEPWPWRTPAGKALVPNYSMVTCNPDTKLHWIYRRFHPDSGDHWEKRIPHPELAGRLRRSAPKVSYADLGYKLFQMDSLDNIHLSEQNRVQLLSRSDEFIDRYVHGNWGSSRGLIHQITNDSIVEPTEEVLMRVFSDRNTFHRSYDHGDYAPSCMLWWVVDPEGNHICYREYYQGNVLISRHRRAIHDIQARAREAYMEPSQFQTSLADPAIFNKTMQSKGGRYSVSDEYEDVTYDRETAIFFDRADNDEFGTRNLINELLKVDPKHPNPFTGEMGAPRLYFIQRTVSYPHGCVKAVMQLESQRREKVGTYLGEPVFSDDRDESIEDHAYDPVRYHVAGRLSAFEAKTPKRLAGTFKGNLLLLKRIKAREGRRMGHVARREAKRYGRI